MIQVCFLTVLTIEMWCWSPLCTLDNFGCQQERSGSLRLLGDVGAQGQGRCGEVSGQGSSSADKRNNQSTQDLIFLVLFFSPRRLCGAGALDSKWEKPSGLDKISTRPVMGLACLKSRPNVLHYWWRNAGISLCSIVWAFSKKKKKTSFHKDTIQRVKDQYTVRSTSIISSIVPQHTNLNSSIVMYMGSVEKNK